MISYYELLGVIKEGNIPERVEYGGDIFNYSKANGTFYCEKTDVFLDELFDAKNSFNKDIAIIENKKLKKLKIENNNNVVGKWEDGRDYCYTLSAPQMVLANKINEIIEVINEEKEIQDNQK